MDAIIIAVAIVAAVVLILLSIWYLKKATPAYPKKIIYTPAIAGDVNGQGSYSSPCILNDINYFEYRTEDESINIADYLPFIVTGNSMAQEGLSSGDVILVKKLIGDDRQKILKNRVVLFKIHPINKIGDAEFKLRHFLGYVDSKKDNLGDVVCEGVSEDEIKEKYNKVKEDHPTVEMFIYSSTFKVKERKLSCSFHPLDSLIGQVEYSFPQSLLN